MAVSYFLTPRNLVLTFGATCLLEFIFLAETKPYFIVEMRLPAKIARQFRTAIMQIETIIARPMQLD